jgi:hypothetical protein
MDEREFPRHVDEILLRADLLCAVLGLIGKKTDGVLASSPQAAIQGIYVRSLFRGLPTSVPPNASTTQFPSGNPHTTYFNQESTCSRHALTNDKGVVFQSSFEVHHAKRARVHETSNLTHRLFNYAGGRVKLRLWAHISTSLKIGPRLDGDKFAYFHFAPIFHVLKLRFPDGTEKEVYNSSTAFNGELDLNGGTFKPGHHTRFAREDKRDGSFASTSTWCQGNITLCSLTLPCCTLHNQVMTAGTKRISLSNCEWSRLKCLSNHLPCLRRCQRKQRNNAVT